MVKVKNQILLQISAAKCSELWSNTQKYYIFPLQTNIQDFVHDIPVFPPKLIQMPLSFYRPILVFTFEQFHLNCI